MVMILGGSGTISSDKITSDANGNFGVGTTTPAYKLDIKDNTTGQQLRLSSSHGNGTSMAFDSSSANGRVWRIGSNYVDGYGEFAIYDATASLRRLNIDSSGRVTKSYQPAFKVGRSGSGNVTTDETIPFTDVVLNVGSHFNTSTYRFTSPVAGYYLLSVGGMNNQSSTGASLFRIWKNGSQISYFHIIATHPSSTSYTFVQYMNASDYIYVTGQHYHYNTASNGYDYPYFSGYLLG